MQEKVRVYDLTPEEFSRMPKELGAEGTEGVFLYGDGFHWAVSKRELHQVAAHCYAVADARTAGRDYGLLRPLDENEARKIYGSGNRNPCRAARLCCSGPW